MNFLLQFVLRNCIKKDIEKMNNLSERLIADIEVPKPVRWWLLAGVVMVIFQIVIGGITRLTGSGLSITEWAPIMGVIPPLDAAGWNEAFDLYKATPQFEKINPDMDMAGFKFIYFWEWFHRLWARMLATVFFIGFFYFLWKKWMPNNLMRHLGVIVGLGALEGGIGWIMVASGLNDRPWVNAYKLTIHLSMGLLIFSYLFWTFLKTIPMKFTVTNKIVNKSAWMLATVVAFFQIMLGGMMSGMKAGLAYPTWPDQGGKFVPDVLMESSAWNYRNVDVYDGSAFMPALVQFLHRNVAYVLITILLYIYWKQINKDFSASYKQSMYVMVFLLIVQVLLGIFTLINCKGNVPVTLGVVHQGVAVLLFAALLNLNYRVKKQYY